MLRWLLFIGVLIPLGDLVLLAWLSQRIGVGTAIALVLVTGMVGGNLARREGFRVWRDAQASLASGQPPAEAALEGVLVVLGGAYLLAPGVATDVIGLLLLVPPLRKWLARVLRVRFQNQLASGGLPFRAHSAGVPSTPTRGSPGGGPNVVETTGETVPDADAPLRRLE